MKKLYILLLFIGTVSTFGQTNVGISGNVDGVYINEFHYDNQGTDVNEFVEVAGPAGTDLSTYTITLYNGSNNTSYSTTPLTGTIDDEGAGVGAVVFLISGIQNGAPDAIALSKTGSTSVQYLSYEGIMNAVAVDGPAMGLNSFDIGVAEAPTSTVGDLLGYSLEYDETTMSWIVITDDSPGIFAQGPVLSTSSFAMENLKVFVNNNNLFVTTNTTDDKQVNVYNMQGREVVNTTTAGAGINVSDLASGIYIVKVTENGISESRKIAIK